MREFKLLRYFKKWWWLVAVCSVLGGIAFSRYAISSQTYVAQTVLSYTNTEAATGQSPDGTVIDPTEITSSWVISEALESAGIDESVDRVRTRLSISEVIPDDVAAVQKAAWAEGLEYEYFPTEYVISYNSGTGSSADEARAILEAVVDGYYRYYGQNHVEASLPPSNLSALLTVEHDALELVETLDEYVESTLAYVEGNAAYSPAFRSVQSGYSFSNLAVEYELFQQSTLPALYARVIGGRVSESEDVLTAKYARRIEENNQAIENLKARGEDLTPLSNAFVEKNQASMDYHWSQQDENAAARGSNYVLNQVYEFEGANYQSEQPTYDQLLLASVQNSDAIAALEQDNVYCRYVLSRFSSASPADEAERQAAREKLNEACAALLELEAILTGAVNEYMDYRAAQNLAITSTVNVYSTMNTSLYLALAVVLFFLIGCVGAVVLGRGQDFVDYMVYTDHVTALPNRRRCDQMIDSHSQKPVEPPFGCVLVRVDNVAALNRAGGYAQGNQALADMGKMLTLCAEGFGFVGYNEGAQFVGLFENCTGDRARHFLSILASTADRYNAENPDAVILYRAASAAAEMGDALTARDLLRRCHAELEAAP